MILIMDIHKLNIIIIWMLIFSGVHCSVNIETVDDEVDIKKTDHGYALTMEENNHKFSNKKALFKITESDCTHITLNFFSSNSFTYNIDDCILYSLQAFDYEVPTQRSYSMLIIDGTTTETQVKIYITNIDDEVPILHCPNCILDENTMYDKDNTPCFYTLEDPDGFLSFMTITVNNELDKTFEVITNQDLPNETYSTEEPLINLITLNYKTTDFYSFSVTVIDSGNNNATVNAIINVNDIRNTNPRWTKIINFAEFPEKSVQEFDVKAIDGDTGINSSICYEITGQDDLKQHSDYDIKIDKNTGHIIVKNIDRDKYDINVIEVNITACVCDETDWCTPQKLNYYIEDIDDHSPIIVKNTYLDGTDQEFNDNEPKIVNIEFLENFSGSFNFSSLIQDIDTGENAQFEVQLVPEGDFDYTVAYIIVPTAGYKFGNFKISVSDKTYLDYENPTWINNYFHVSI
ncbi:unnamed protein product [Psylliodes chrysocephalus]|uniref:Cadherin domain-containing protein n=1 Tax=Psylliodes chrysocephalus TaxID=3402493 RepID=A0A9P0D4C4_9CUCU|nr:unnamed protein product [Psylliodes chrysocephala]